LTTDGQEEGSDCGRTAAARHAPPLILPVSRHQSQNVQPRSSQCWQRQLKRWKQDRLHRRPSIRLAEL